MTPLVPSTVALFSFFFKHYLRFSLSPNTSRERLSSSFGGKGGTRWISRDERYRVTPSQLPADPRRNRALGRRKWNAHRKRVD
ncbi:hypothetical protein CEXT_154411 [Caerostris extrusa]|uniref:Secreted protein n=1 Tax=Caerostris extrusa TaxID=172846 RepID=A0AAV4XJN2_CAEEX|nr:hypothetical protein CEXT_154411 [Caerostris extrusa]